MHILHVIPGLTVERGGPSTVVRMLANRQARAGLKVSLLTTDQGERAGEHPLELDAGILHTRVNVKGSDRLAYAPGFAKEMRQQLSGCDVVHVHSIFTYPVHTALREALWARVPVVLRPCGILHRYSLKRRHWPKRVYLNLWGGMVERACSAWHYTSENEAAQSWPWKQKPHFVLPNGIEPDELKIEDAQALTILERKWPGLGGAPYVLFLGRLHPKKRLDLLLAAFREVSREGQKLVIAGPDECGSWPELAALLLRDPEMARRVIRIELVAGVEKAALLAGARVFALPSEHENFGVAALEALAVGTPVLLAPQVDLIGVIKSADWGEVIPLEISAWGAAIARCLAQPRQTATERNCRREWIAERFSWESIAARLTEHYRTVISGSRQTSGQLAAATGTNMDGKSVQ